MSLDVAILIVTYNSEEQIEACLESVLRERHHISQEVIVLDNDSKDGTVALVRKKFPEVRLIQPGRNLGFAAGVNAAARCANARYLLLLNPDTVVLDQAVDVVIDFADANPRYGLYGGRTLKPDGSLEPSSCWGLPTLWSLAMFATGLTTVGKRNPVLDPESLGGWKRDTVREVGVITGCFLLVSASAWQKLGGFDERFFMYGEDTDLSMRARAFGFKPVICPNAKVVHEIGQSSATPTHKMLLLYRGKASLLRTHWAGLKQRLGLNLLALGIGFRAFLSQVKQSLSRSKQPNRYLEVWKQRNDWLQGYPRKAVQADSREAKPDDSTLPLLTADSREVA